MRYQFDVLLFFLIKKVTKKSRKNDAATRQMHPASRFFMPPARHNRIDSKSGHLFKTVYSSQILTPAGLQLLKICFKFIHLKKTAYA